MIFSNLPCCLFSWPEQLNTMTNTILGLETFETLITILTIENLNS